MERKTAAVIDIASNELSMKIAERCNEKIHVIDTLKYPLSLGKDTFHYGKISFEAVEKTSSIIKGFKSVMREYNVDTVRAIATTAVREAENKAYILDQIKIKTGLTLDVIDDSQEKTYINKLILHRLPEEYRRSALMVHLGSGNIGISAIENFMITSTQNIKTGALRLSELFENILDRSEQYSFVIKEYLQTFIETVEKLIPKNLKYFIVYGNDIDLIGNMCNAQGVENAIIITKQEFSVLYKNIRDKTPAQIAAGYDISIEKADVLLPAIIIYNKLFKYTKAEKILSPLTTLSDAILFEMLFPKTIREYDEEYSKSTVLSAKIISERFNIDREYTQRVECFVLKIYDKLKKLHGLGKRERLLLEISAILQNIGKFVNVKQHNYHSYNIIKGLDIVGLNNHETLIVASVALYHSSLTPALSQNEYALLSPADRVLVSKLSAILRLAVSLNQSHNYKFDDIDVKLNSEALTITAATYKNIELESWAFASKAKLFEDVFGIKAVFKKRMVI